MTFLGIKRAPVWKASAHSLQPPRSGRIRGGHGDRDSVACTETASRWGPREIQAVRDIDLRAERDRRFASPPASATGRPMLACGDRSRPRWLMVPAQGSAAETRGAPMLKPGKNGAVRTRVTADPARVR